MRAKTVSIPPLTFFALTYALSWLIWVPLVLSHFEIGPFRIPEGVSNVVRLLGVLMPATAALWLTARAGGRSQIKSLLGRLTIWRVGWQWWAAAGLVHPVLLLSIGLAYNWLGGDPPVTSVPPVPPVALAVNVFFLTLATLGEEIGWRGVAFPALQQRHSALTSSVILGLVWATWHLPFWLLLDTYAQYGLGYLALNYLLILPMSMYITWVYNHGRSSLLLAVAFHITFNIVNVALLPVTTNIGAFGWVIVAEWVLAALVFLRLEPSPRLAPAMTD
jgi:membrane protease YdiL (CAAX protease family)